MPNREREDEEVYNKLAAELASRIHKRTEELTTEMQHFQLAADKCSARLTELNSLLKEVFDEHAD